MSTRISADGYSDDVTISGSAGFAGTLTWTAVGPVPVGPGGTCDDADFTGPALFNTDTELVIGDGTTTITPAVGPTDEGCYSYGVVLDGPNFTAQVVSPVGLPEETLFQPAPPTTTTATTTVAPTTTVSGSPPTSAAPATTEPGAAPPPGAAPGVTTTTDPGPAAPPTGLLPATGRGGLAGPARDGIRRGRRLHRRPVPPPRTRLTRLRVRGSRRTSRPRRRCHRGR